jgi:hypothetical protein
MTRAWQLFVTGAIVLVFGLTLPPVSVRGADSITVKLSVDASESFGNPLSYQWRATDGHIVHPDALTTDWILPNGPGIHFAYVLISNGKGGFTEGRIAVNTDKNPTSTVVPRDQYPVVQQFHAAPTADPRDPQIKGTVRLEDGSVCGTRNPFFFDVYVTAEVALIPPTFGTPQSLATLNPYADGIADL